MTNLERLFRRVNEDYFYRGRRLGFPYDWFRIVIRNRRYTANFDLSSPGFPNPSDWEAFNFVRQFVEHKRVQRFFQERLKRVLRLRTDKRFAIKSTGFFGSTIKTKGLDLWLDGREVLFRPEFQYTFKNIKRQRKLGEVLISDLYRARGPHQNFFQTAFRPAYSNGLYITYLKIPWTKPYRILLPTFLEKGLIWLEFFFFPGEWSLRGLIGRFLLFFFYCIVFAWVCNFCYSLFFISVRNSIDVFVYEGTMLSQDFGPSTLSWWVQFRIKIAKRFFAIRYDILSILKERRARKTKNE